MSNKDNRNPLLFTLVVINTFVVGFLFIQQSKLTNLANQVVQEQTSPASSPTPEQNEFKLNPKVGNIIQEFPIQAITANLARPHGPQRFVTLKIVFILETPVGEATDEMTNKMPTFRDEIIDMLNTRKPEDVLKLEGRGVLKDLIERHLNQKLKRDKIRKILFTQFKVS